MRLPPRYLRTLLLRGVTLALMAHLIGLAIFAAANDPGGSAVVPFWVVMTAPVLNLIDLHRRKELALLHNLGVVTAAAVLAASVPAVLMEGLLVLAR